MTPALVTSLRGYGARDFRADLGAGVTVAMVALPLSLAIAIASGAAPETGLVTAVVAGFLISALGGSRVQIGGPTGAFIVVVAGVIAAHGYSGLVTATFMAGVILLVAGLARAGRLIGYVPEAVINGFTLGIAAIIALSQLKDLLGMDAAMPADAVHKAGALWAARGEVNPWALGIGLATMGLIVVLRRAFPRLPGLIVAVGATSALVAGLGLPVDSIADRFGTLPDSLPMPRLPDLSPAKLRELLPSAIVIAFLAGIESLLSALVADRMIRDRHRPNAEVLAQGAANVASSLFGGLPATGAIARTATNIRAGGRTPVAGMIHAGVVLAAILLAAPLASGVAMPALAGLLLLTAWNMAEPQNWRGYLRDGPLADRVLLGLTMVLTVLVDLTVAIGVGVALGLLLRLSRRVPPPDDWTPRDR
ncbi:SulP family inorganic anion transporter [Anianabacter salinae]|uniref:SulP family inorganic anion transporter n=1 Tax=Anianabacter salinae TaxID=2851023 RepID=UPI00225E364C|nr:SulP family inorganic anion transporter [Anianabacter salinae]MBV0911249.1 SulP family inorganic anion transporter [Anianabacter salinae]